MSLSLMCFILRTLSIAIPLSIKVTNLLQESLQPFIVCSRIVVLSQRILNIV